MTKYPAQARLLQALLCVALLFHLTLANGQQPAPHSGGKFTLIGISKLPYRTLYYRNGGEFIPVELEEGRRSSAYSIAAAEFLELYTDHADPEEKYQLIGKAPLIAGAREMLYFLKHLGSGNKRGLPVALFGLDDSLEKFPHSSYRFINFMNQPLLLEFDNERFGMRAGESKISKLDLPAEGAFTSFRVRNIEKKRLAGTRLFSSADSREMVLIFPSKPGKRRLDIRYFSD
jgi:hypothetical protein